MANKYDKPLIADGGITYSGDITKAKLPDEFRVDPHDNDIPYSWERKDG